jgi:hypothetical protein
MSNLRELGRAPEPLRTRPDEPDPIRAFTGYFNGQRDPNLYRAHLIRYPWHERWNVWVHPDATWAVSLCDRDAYPYRWRGGVDLVPGGDEAGESYVPEVADMKLCAACERALRATAPELEGRI